MKSSKLLSQIKTLLNAKLNLAQQTLEDGVTIIEAESFEAGQAVFIVSDDERVALPVGEYNLQDGKILVVAEEGKISEIKEAMEVEKMEDDEEEKKEEMSEEEIVVEAPEEVVEEVSEVVEAVVEAIAPVIEEVKQEVEELRKKFEKHYGEEDEKEKKEEKMSSQRPARKPLKHSPETTKSAPRNLYAQNRAFNTTKERVFNKIFNK